MKLTCPQCGQSVLRPAIILAKQINCPACGCVIPLEAAKPARAQPAAPSGPAASSPRPAPAPAQRVGVCRKCKTFNPGEERSCAKCGTPLYETCLLCQAEHRVGSDNCGACGVELSKLRPLQDLPRLRSERRHASVLALLDGLGQASLPASFEQARAEARQAVAEAEGATARATQAASAGQPAQAISEYEQALRSCADFQPALAGAAGIKRATANAKRVRVSAIAAACVLALGAGLIFGVPAWKRMQDGRAWQAAASAAQAAGEDYERATESYRAYLAARPDGLHAAEARTEIETALPQKIEEREWKRVRDQFAAAGSQHDRVIALCREFIAKHPSNKNGTEARRIIDERTRQMAEDEWKAVQQSVEAAGADLPRALKTLDDYLGRNPPAAQRTEAAAFKQAFITRHYTAFMEEGKKQEEAKQWKAAAAAYANAAALKPDEPEPRRSGQRAAQAERQEQFDAAMKEGQQAEAGKDRPKALAAYERASGLMPNHREARQAVERIQAAERQERFEAGMKEGGLAEAAKSWDAAIEAYSKAAEALPQDNSARAALQRARNAKNAAALAALMATAQEAESKSNWVAARAAFLEMSRLAGSSRDVDAALRRIDLAETTAKYTLALAEARLAEARADWLAARRHYEAALAARPGDPDCSRALHNVGTYEKPAGTLLASFEGHGNKVSSAAYSPDGLYLLTGSYDQTARLWSVASGQAVRTFQTHGTSSVCVAFSPDGKKVVAGGSSGTLQFWTTAGQELNAFHGPPALINSVAYSADGRLLLSGASDGTMRHWHAADGSTAIYEDAGGFLKALGRAVGESIELNGKPIASSQTRSHSQPVMAVTYSRDGQHALSGSQDRTAKVWDTRTRKLLHTLKGHTNFVSCVAFHPDSARALTGSYDNTVKLWNTATGKEVFTLNGHSAYVFTVAFSPDGRFVLSGGEDKTIRLWEAATGRSLRTLPAQEPVTAVAFSPDGRYAVSGGQDRAVKLWKLWDGNKTGP